MHAYRCKECGCGVTGILESNQDVRRRRWQCMNSNCGRWAVEYHFDVDDVPNWVTDVAIVIHKKYPMRKLSSKEFIEKVLNRRIELTKSIFANKSKEYSVDDDYLMNFRVGARLDDSTPEEILWGYMLKQFVAVRKMVKNPDEIYPRELIDEKIGDVINYLYLLEGILYAKNTTER